jgi:hypothetical protein
VAFPLVYNAVTGQVEYLQVCNLLGFHNVMMTLPHPVEMVLKKMTDKLKTNHTLKVNVTLTGCVSNNGMVNPTLLGFGLDEILTDKTRDLFWVINLDAEFKFLNSPEFNKYELTMSGIGQQVALSTLAPTLNLIENYRHSASVHHNWPIGCDPEKFSAYAQNKHGLMFVAGPFYGGIRPGNIYDLNGAQKINLDGRVVYDDANRAAEIIAASTDTRPKKGSDEEKTCRWVLAARLPPKHTQLMHVLIRSLPSSVDFFGPTPDHP